MFVQQVLHIVNAQAFAFAALVGNPRKRCARQRAAPGLLG